MANPLEYEADLSFNPLAAACHQGCCKGVEELLKTFLKTCFVCVENRGEITLTKIHCASPFSNSLVNKLEACGVDWSSVTKKWPKTQVD